MMYFQLSSYLSLGCLPDIFSIFYSNIWLVRNNKLEPPGENTEYRITSWVNSSLYSAKLEFNLRISIALVADVCEAVCTLL